MKYIFTLLSFVLVFASISFGQEIKTHTIDGETYFVYPYPQFARSKMMPKSIKSYGQLKQLFTEQIEMLMEEEASNSLGKALGKELTPELKKMYVDMAMKDLTKNKKKYKEMIKLSQVYEGPRFKASGYSMKKDIPPSLDSIPDGKYVQFFEVKEFVDGYDSTVVSAIFEVKNSQFNGLCTRYYVNGEVALKGNYLGGMKTGEWIFYERDSPDVPESVKEYKKALKNNKKDTLVILNIDTTIANYENGYLNGEYFNVSYGYKEEYGSYRKGNPIGSWLKIQGNDTLLQYTIVRDSLEKCYQPIVRTDVNFQSYRKQNKGYVSAPALEIKDLYFIKEPTKYNSLKILDDFYYSDYDYEMDLRGGLEEAFESVGKELDENERYTYSKDNPRFDTLGYYIPYQNSIERRYFNGQLMYRIEIENNCFVEPDTIFFDNGKPFNVLTEIPDSNQYKLTQYYYNGELDFSELRDSLGIYIESQEEEEPNRTIVLDGLTYYEASRDMRYYVNDTLNTEGLKGEYILQSERDLADSSVTWDVRYNTETRQHISHGMNWDGDTTYRKLRKYSEDLESYQLEIWQKLVLDLELEKKGSCGLQDDYEIIDSVPKYYLVRKSDFYDCNLNYVVKQDGKPYTGSFTAFKNIKLEDDKLRFTKEGIVLEYGTKPDFIDRTYAINIAKEALLETTDEGERKRLEKKIKKYKKEEKKRQSYPKSCDLRSDFEDLFPQVDIVNYEVDRVEGNIVDGKPDGEWKTYNSDDVLLAKASYSKGELHGIQESYGYVEKSKKLSKEERKMLKKYSKEMKELLEAFGGMPDQVKKAYSYVQRRSEFKDGVQINDELTFDEKGKVQSRFSYENGEVNGKALLANNKYVYTTANFLEGYRDGLSEVYFKNNDKDSVLIYKIMYQNGLLQGQSEVYHGNGQLAKEGFFLDNQPIETYNGYDTLGNLIHYVKFDKGFVSEEKIWEENELSALYEFAWEDSVYFETFDFIDNKDFIDRFTTRRGLPNYRIMQGYYGRESMVHDENENYFLTKFYPNKKMARKGQIVSGDKDSLWAYFDVDGVKLYEVYYQDTVIKINDTLELETYGIYTDFNAKGEKLSKRYLIEMNSKYDCANSDHFELRQFYIDPAVVINKEECNADTVRNYYDSGVLQSEGAYKNGIPVGVWKFFDPNGQINKVGEYVNGKKHGKWLMGDLSKTKYLGDICLNPNMPDIEKVIEYKEKDLDIEIKYYDYGELINSSFFNINLNNE